MVGIAEVARAAGVSKATASRALTGRGYVADDTRARVETAAAELGYIASTNAASLVTGRTQNIGVVLPHVNRWFFAEALEGIQAGLLEHGRDLTLYDAEPGTASRSAIFDTFLGRKRFDGLIAVCIEPDEREAVRLSTLGKPIVSIGCYDIGTSAVSIDDADAAWRATKHLIELGHRRIAFVGGEADGGPSTLGDARRIAGYLAAMQEAGLSEDILHVVSEVSMPGGYAASVDLLGDSRRRPTAIVGMCDEVAIGTIIAARRLGIHVPADLSVVGIDDHEHADMFALTTLQQKPRDQARLAVDILMHHIDGDHVEPRRIWEPARFIVRSSTGPLDSRQSSLDRRAATP
ncbi:MAG TPA: LacI family DNA-binding transcriptional regulator [Microbacterium sp.]|uniref:LacI family DNA-binding transcriptional regulator n=1 Tax=Microbacterium sp. TaxID=51671 RepID=UPI002CD5C396|nr:LacI family DNA-binding transcriptional regulator [Microbacterium sp.]HWI31857.1 LacI family DNA-binding transcriptional regulator [Microbacterium sp.]